ncbi:unnamed protein product, partial [Polarella glacialis]
MGDAPAVLIIREEPQRPVYKDVIEAPDFLKPPDEAHYNFRNQPLETFDFIEKFETGTPEEWMAIVNADTARPQACVVHYKAKQWTMLPCWVLEYDEVTKRYHVELEDATRKKVKRLSTRFNAEDPDNFAARVDYCKAQKAHCELQESFIDYIEAKHDSLVTPMPRKAKEGFIRTALEKCHLEDPNSHAPIIRELMNEVEQNYVLSMKLHTVKRELMIAYSTEDAELDEENQFASVMVVFLPKQIPWSALVQHHTADLRVFEVVAEMVQMPILAASTFEMTSLVWR